MQSKWYTLQMMASWWKRTDGRYQVIQAPAYAGQFEPVFVGLAVVDDYGNLVGV